MKLKLLPVFFFLLLTYVSYSQIPTITALSPTSGAVGTLVTITGTNLSTPTEFIIGGKTAIKISSTNTQLVGMVMPGAVTGKVAISTAGGVVNTVNDFSVISTAYPTTQQGTKLIGTGASFASQGTSVSVSADGNTAIVGGPTDNLNQGAAWIFTRTDGTWNQQGGKLIGTGSIGAAKQGTSVSLSADGNTAIVGGWLDNGNLGAAWVYTRKDGFWTQQGAKLVGTGATGLADCQGTSVSLSADGNTAIVGGFADNNEQGAVWVFTRSGETWTQEGTKLVGSGAIGPAYQGGSVSLSADGNTAIIGGRGDNSSQGAAWIFTRHQGTWTQAGAKLVGTEAGGAAAQGWVSISADGNTAIVGGPDDRNGNGAAWVFVRSNSIWIQQGAKLMGLGGLYNPSLGNSVSLSADGNTAIIGGYNDNSDQGATWVFTRSNETWMQRGAKLIAMDGGGRMGISVSISADGGTGVIGGDLNYSNNLGTTGATWVFNYVPAPTISSISPLQGKNGDTITIAGQNFLTANSVTFGGVKAASFKLISPTQIKAVLGDGDSGSVNVTTSSGEGAINGFKYWQQQIISFNQIPIKILNTPDFDPGAVTSSGLPIIYTSSDTTVATIVKGNIHIIAPGSTNITASQAGNNIFTAASPITRLLTVNAPLVVPNISYTGSQIYTAGVTINAFVPINTGAGITGGFAISPSLLPFGLIFDTATGIISGTPTSISASTTYTVTASNGYGSSTTTFSLTVKETPMLNDVPTLSYPGPQTYTVNTGISILTPTSTGVAAPGYSNTPVALGSGFSHPEWVAQDAVGNLYVTDAGNNNLKKIPYAGSSFGSPITLASGFIPRGIAVDAAGNVYITDWQNKNLKKITYSGGTYGSPAVIASGLTNPYGVAVDAAGNVFVADGGNNTIKKIAYSGGTYSSPTAICTVSGIPSGTVGVQGLTVDAGGNVYFTDKYNKTVNKITYSGGSYGSPAVIASGLNGPYGVTVDATGNVFVVYNGSNNLEKIPFVDGDYGSPVQFGSGFSRASGLAIDATGNLYVADYNNGLVKELNPSVGGYTISPALPAGLTFNNTTGIIIGTPTVTSPATTYTVTAYNNSGSATATINLTVNAVGPQINAPVISYAGPQTYTLNTTIAALKPISSGVAAPGYSYTPAGSGFNHPEWVASDAAGNLYVTDAGNNNVKKIPYAGGTFGTPVVLASGFIPRGIAVDAAGNVYLADWQNKNLKKITYSGGTYSSPVVIESGLINPYGVAVDAAGNVYVADASNNTIKEIPYSLGSYGSPTVIYTVPGIASGTVAVQGVAVDATANIYYTDAVNKSVNKIPYSSGSYGSPSVIASGLKGAYGVTVDASGTVFVVFNGSYNLEKIPYAGGIYGTPVQFGSGFARASGIALDAGGNPYVADYNNGLVKKVTLTGGYYISPSLPAGLTLNSTTGVISGKPTVTSAATAYSITGYNSSGGTTATVKIAVVTSVISLNSFYQPNAADSAAVKAQEPEKTKTITLDEVKVEANNILSPNGDGVNDTWIVKNIGFYPNNKVTVYDRAGNVLYSKNGYTNDWAGTYRGSVLGKGTYYYLIDLGNGKNTKGFFTVVND